MAETPKKPKLVYCCPVKEYFSKDKNLVGSLDISPRIIVCKRALKVNQAYEQNIIVKNNGLFHRYLKCYTDSGDDTHLKLHGIQRLEYVPPATTININVRIMPNSKKLLYRSRNIFIESEHPNIIFEIPIIVVKSFKDPYMPSSITFPSTVPRNATYYEFTIYNPTTDAATVLLRSLHPCLSAQSDAPRVNPKDFIRVLLKLVVKDAEIVTDIMKIRFSNVQLPIGYFHKPTMVSLYPNTSFICFEETKFGRENRKEFQVCNDAFISVPFNFQFEQRERLSMLQSKPTSGDSSLSSSISSSSMKELFSTEMEPETSLTDTAIFKNYTIEPMCGEFKPNSCNSITIIFKPQIDAMEMDPHLVPPFSAGLQVLLTSPNYECDEKYLWVSGLIDGPDAHISPKAIDFRQVFLGEEHCEKINITNTDEVVVSKITYFDYSGDDSCKISITPKEGLILEPCEMDSFTFNFFTTIVGKIFFKIRFKIRNGKFLTVIVKANSVCVRVKTFPDIVEFGSIPFAVPQKRTVLLMNPLSVPLSLQCFIPDNGSEMPLVLNVENIDELPPVDTRNPIESILAAKFELVESAYDLSELEEVFNPRSNSSIFNSIDEESDSDDKNLCSPKFQTEVIEHIDRLANKVVNNIKLKRIPEKNEPDVKIIYEVTQELLELPYFEELTKFNNYACMNWETIPSDPTELYYDTEIIHLKPNAGRSITVLVIPNIVGYFNRAIHIRCCPHSQLTEWDRASPNSNHVMVESDVMITKLWVEYNCCIPDIKWTENIILKEHDIYAMQLYDFNMKFTNHSNIGGFIQYLIVPHCTEGVMGFRNHKWKFFVNLYDSVEAQCYVEFRRTGNVRLTGMLKIVGNISGLPFHISAHVLPTKVELKPRYIYRRQNVLEKTRVCIYIYNKTPTITVLNMHLRSERYQQLEPHGAQLGPNQVTYVSILTTFPDPEVYKNILYVDLMHGVVLEVPMTFNIIGMPVFFDPEIRKGLDAGVILLSSEEDYEERTTNYSKKIRVWNMGERTYGITFRRLKARTSTRTLCSADALRAQFYVEPKLLVLPPGGEDYITITAVACEEAIVYNEFSVNIIDQSDTMRFSSIRFTLTAKFSEVELAWSRKEVTMTYNRTHKFKQHPQIEIVRLINVTGTDIESLRLRVCGPFRIKELFEHPFAREIEVSLKSDEKKEITITYDKKEFCNKMAPSLRGRIYTFANNKPQKSLALRVNINYPDIIIVHSNIVFFASSSAENTTDVLIENVGTLIAQYKWKKMDQYTEYVADYDDAWAFSRDLLSDIVQMLDLHEKEELSEDSVCQRNMTLCYQKYRCKLKKLEDSGGVFEILDEIVENLDLEQRRYKMELSEGSAIQSETSSQKYVNQTLDKILTNLKLEDSYDISEPSEEECDKYKSVYFFEKVGVVLPDHGAHCLLHVPPVRKGHAVKASFVLDVVGGPPQTLDITLVNLDKVVDLSPFSVYLGVKPWYEFFEAKVKARNITQYNLHVVVSNCPRPKIENRHHYHLVDGYVCIQGPRRFHLNPFGGKTLKTEGIMGFSDEFIRDFKLTINDQNKTCFRLRGQGIMPILLAPNRKIPRPEQGPEEIYDEYRFLQRIYYFYMFRDITFVDEELDAGKEESHLDDDWSEDFDFSDDMEGEDEGGVPPWITSLLQHKWMKLLSTYVYVINNESLPNPTILEQILSTVKFKHYLEEDPEAKNTLQRIFRHYMKMECTYDEKMPISLKYFTVTPLPYEQLGYVLDMPNLKLNQFRNYDIDLQFFGPGKLIAAARTAVKIPGLYVHFEVKRNTGKCHEFVLYRAEEKMPDFYTKRYRNMWEREIDLEADPKLHHAHSYDCQLRCKLHQRDITAKDRREIKNYYNSFSKSTNFDKKHHFVNCSIFSKSRENFSDTIIRVHILIKPDAKYYTEYQIIEDYLYIDLHMGPTLPILLRGIIK